MAFEHICPACDGKGRIESRGGGTVFEHDTYFEHEWLRPVERTREVIARYVEPKDSGPKGCPECGGTGISAGHQGKDERTCGACRQARADLAPLVELLRTFVRPALELELSRAEDARSLPEVGSRFGGQPYAERGDAWPRCPGCGQSLAFIGQFDPREAWTPLGRSVGLFTFFYCWTCEPSGLAGEPAGSWIVRPYAAPDVARAARIEPAEPLPRVTTPCAVRARPIDSLPDWDEVEWRHPELKVRAARLAPAEPYAPYQAAEREVVGDHSIGTQLGGYGCWIQDAPRRRCRECGEPLGFVLQIDSLSEADCDWGLSGLAYLLSCPEHPGEWALDIQRT